jgi:predicted RNA-binding protein with PUA-like domain
MTFYLLKTEPSEYSFADLQKDKTTVWDGVTSPAAVKHLREMQKGAQLVIYHTGDERQVVGTASVVKVEVPEPKSPQVTIKVGRAIVDGPTLADLKSKKLFADSPLVKIGRLSVVPLTEAQFEALTAK